MSATYPPVAFYFQLSIEDSSGRHNVAFKEVSGITAEMNIEEIAEGGENRFKHRLPTTPNYSNLVLKRGLAKKDDPLIDWCIQTLEGNIEKPITTKNLLVKLVDENGSSLKSWRFINAWPVKWSMSDFNSTDTEIVVETLEVVYSYFKVI